LTCKKDCEKHFIEIIKEASFPAPIQPHGEENSDERSKRYNDTEVDPQVRI
jgi:hypothetical protein